jgi:hypothetical protein
MNTAWRERATDYAGALALAGIWTALYNIL